MADSLRYTVSHTGRAPGQLEVLVARARELGCTARLAAFLRVVHDELRDRPLVWGEPKYRIGSMELISCVGFYDRIRVSYGVHERRPIVFLNFFEPQLGHPLYVPPDA